MSANQEQPPQPTQTPESAPAQAPPGRRFTPALLLASVLCIVCVGLAVAATLGYLDSQPSDSDDRGGQRLDARRFGTLDQQFDLTGMSIPREELHSGGPSKDGIPALSDPLYVPAGEAQFLDDGDRVIGVVLGDDARAFPLRILDFHEAVNEVIADVPIVVTYCPLCDSALVFDRRVNGRTVEFGISGLLYNSNVLLFDRNNDGPEGLWTQMGAHSVGGPEMGTTLKSIPCELTTWSDWLGRHPDSVVLSTETGHTRVYDGSAYATYFQQQQLMFPVNPMPAESELNLKDRVLGIWSGESARAYALVEFRDVGQALTIEDDLDGLHYKLLYDPEPDTIRILEADEGLDHAYSFWFAWYAFHPETDIYRTSSE